ncbi:MAG: ATP-binding protein [Bacteroidales bacterium]|nr:ATP-binding protein [Bacteroidales bacterium]
MKKIKNKSLTYKNFIYKLTRKLQILGANFMIIKFSVKNFKVIKDEITLSFEATKSDELEEYYIATPTPKLRLLKLAIIYGPNASGKTTILEALNFLRNLVVKPLPDKTVQFDNLKPFLGNEESKKSNTSFKLEIVSKGTKYLYEVELNQKAIIKENLYRYKPKKALVYARTTDIDKELTQIKFGPTIRLDKNSKTILIYNTLWNNTVLGAYLKTNLALKELQDVINWFKNKLKPIITPRTELFPFISDKLEEERIDKTRIIKLLKKADFWINNIVINKETEKVTDKTLEKLKIILPEKDVKQIEKQGKITIKGLLFEHFVNNQEFILPLKEESAGTKRYYEFCGILDMMLNNEIIVPIDELESSLHPDLIKHFLLTFLKNNKNSQLIATTHYRELLMEKDILRKDAIWFTERKKDGSTDLYSLADFDTSKIRKTSSIYNAYKIGKLGAVPNLKDFYLDIENEKN